MSLKEMQEKYIYAFNNFKNGILIIEGIEKVFKNIPVELISVVSLKRTFKVDIIISFNSWKLPLHPKIISNSSNILLFKTTEQVEKYKNIHILNGFFPIIGMAENCINSGAKMAYIELDNNSFNVKF